MKILQLLLILVVAVWWTDSQNINADLQRWVRSLFYQPNRLNVRREIRAATETDRQNFFRAINMLKNDRSIWPNKYDALCSLHSVFMNVAHQGPNFPGWHRVYLILFENALKQVVPGVYVPFWNNTLESSMLQPSLSSMWTPQMVGSGAGQVSNGPFSGWSTPHGRLRRLVGRGGRLMTERDERNILSRNYLQDITFPNAPNWTNIEYMHNNVHVWVGGQMRRIESACYDPMFWLHHAYIDCLWEEFRQNQRRRGIDPSNDYPLFQFGQRQHSPNSRLGFGWLLIRHAVHDYFGQNFYSCAPTPSCNRFNRNCGSRYLTCNIRLSKCVPTTMFSRTQTSWRQPSPTSPRSVTPWWWNFG